MKRDLKRIDYSSKFLKQLKKAPFKIQTAFRSRFALFLKDPFDPILDNHLLTGNYLGKRSINITGDWRAIYSETNDENGERVIIFRFLGTHSQLYEAPRPASRDVVSSRASLREEFRSIHPRPKNMPWSSASYDK